MAPTKRGDAGIGEGWECSEAGRWENRRRLEAECVPTRSVSPTGQAAGKSARGKAEQHSA